MTACIVLADSDPGTPCGITVYMHCVRCLEEWQHGTDPATGRPIRFLMSPRQYARTQTGMLPGGSVQVWCNRHECNVAVLRAEVMQ